MPDPPVRTRILFVGVAPTAQKGRNGGAHFHSSRTDALRLGLLRVLDRIFSSDLTEQNERGLGEGTRRLIDLGYFFLHAAKVRPFYDDAPPPAVCFLGKNNLGGVARELFGKELTDSAEKISIGSWNVWAAMAPQPVRGFDTATERVIRELDLAAGGRRA